MDFAPYVESFWVCLAVFISDKSHTNDILCGNNDSSDLPQYCHLLIDYLMIYVLI